jgi:ATP-dependent RNA helicase RhlE
VFNKLRKSISQKSEKSPEIKIKSSRSGFDGLGISESIIKVIARLQFTEPTPVQKQAIPIAIKGQDLIATAQTGTGKTLAFGVAMIQTLNQSKGGRGLVIVPTRELAIQVDASILPLCKAHQMRSAVIIGGVPLEPQCRALDRKPHIIIATPGRLIDHLDRKTINLSDIEILILDEADRMLDMGFAPAISTIIGSLPDRRQTMLFSATMPNEIMTLARKYMDDPAYIEVARSGASPDEITHEIFFVDNGDKTRLLEIQLHKRTGPVLVFSRTKHGARKLTIRIREMGHSVAEIHSNRSLGQRSSALEGFKNGKYRVLVATDIAARGIDVTGIMLVINYDLPSTSEGYVHRIGRTGRAGRDGHAMSFATFAQEKEVRDIEKFIDATLPVSPLPFPPSGRFQIFQDRKPSQHLSKTHEMPHRTRSTQQAPIQQKVFGRRRVNEKKVAK